MKILFALLILAGASPAFTDTLTAARLVRPQSIIAVDDLARVDVAVPGALDGDAMIVGLEARVTLFPGRAIRPGDVGAAALIERNQPVVLVFRRGRLVITAEGRALSRGAAGERVRAMNLNSRSTISGIVSQNGSVLVSH